MNKQEYEEKKRECWEEFCRANPSHNKSIFARKVFDSVFARAYELGKQEKDGIDLKKLDKMLDDALEKETKESLNQWLSEKDAGTVISGWVAIDEAFHQCFLHIEKPIQKAQPIADTGDYDTVWDSNGKTYLLDTGLFPDMDSDSEPQECEIIIKRKKNG